MLIPSTYIPETPQQCLSRTNKSILLVYFLIVSIVMLLCAALPFLYTDVTVVAPGMVRPANERTAVKSSVAGFIRRLNCEEGEVVAKNSVVAYLENDAIKQKTA